MSGAPYSDFRAYLQQELLRRCRSNPKYSLRAFARSLGLDSSELSKLLHGKRAISKRMFEKLSNRLGLAPEERSRLRPVSRSLRNIVPEYQQLSLDSFQVISDWYHYAILELTRVKGFRPEPKWVARVLGITPSEVNIAVERLVRLEMLRIHEDGTWTDESGSVTNVRDGFTATAMRNLQRQILEKAMSALEEIPLERRDQTSMTMAVHSGNLPEAKERIKRFRRDLCEFLQSGGPLDEVYQLGISLYPLTHLNQEKQL